MTSQSSSPLFLQDSQLKTLTTAFQNNEAVCFHNATEALNEFAKVHFTSSLEALMKGWNLEVDVHLEESRDEHTTLTVGSSHEALLHFQQGKSLLFNDVNRLAPELELHLEEIRRWLKLSAHTFSRCLIYATPSGGGNAAHFDQNINFVLQLSGEKTWWTAANTNLSNPIHRHVIGQEINPELESYTADPMPENFSKERASKYELKTGSLLFVPPGVWHQTQASSDALSLNFTFSPPTWSDLIAIALRGRLMQAEVWRETAKDLKNPEQVEKLQFLIEHLASDVSSWSAAELLEALES